MGNNTKRAKVPKLQKLSFLVPNNKQHKTQFEYEIFVVLFFFLLPLHYPIVLDAQRGSTTWVQVAPRRESFLWVNQQQQQQSEMKIMSFL
jgi:hypothetical protein